jgi:signal transduction histidine kinase
VQEALTNVLRHSRDAQARVLLSYHWDAIGIGVTEAGQPAPSKGSRGFDLLDIREHVALFGGRIETGPRPDGGFKVNVHLPTRGGANADRKCGMRLKPQISRHHQSLGQF